KQKQSYYTQTNKWPGFIIKWWHDDKNTFPIESFRGILTSLANGYLMGTGIQVVQVNRLIFYRKPLWIIFFVMFDLVFQIQIIRISKISGSYFYFDLPKTMFYGDRIFNPSWNSIYF